MSKYPPPAMKSERWRVLAAIRRAVNLTSDQKVFLYDIASHDRFEEFGIRPLVRQRMGLTEWKFRIARESLVDAQLVDAVTRPGRSTLYRLNFRMLFALEQSDKVVLVANKTQGVTRQSTRAGSHQRVGAGSQHQKKEPEARTEVIQKNRKKVIRISRSLARELEAVRSEASDEDELDIFQ